MLGPDLVAVGALVGMDEALARLPEGKPEGSIDGLKLGLLEALALGLSEGKSEGSIDGLELVACVLGSAFVVCFGVGKRLG